MVVNYKTYIAEKVFSDQEHVSISGANSFEIKAKLTVLVR